MWGGAEGLGSAFGHSSLSVPSSGTVPRPGTHGENPLKASPGSKRRKRVPFHVELFPGGPSSRAVWEDAEGPRFLSARRFPKRCRAPGCGKTSCPSHRLVFKKHLVLHPSLRPSHALQRVSESPWRKKKAARAVSTRFYYISVCITLKTYHKK